MVKLLVEQGGVVKVSDSGGRTPLIAAAHDGHTEVTKLMMVQGASAEANNSDGRTPLHIAVQNGHVKTVKLLVEYMDLCFACDLIFVGLAAR